MTEEVNVNILISISYVLVAVLAFYILTTFQIIEKEITNYRNDIIVFYSNIQNNTSNLKKNINQDINKIEDKQNLFELNTRKSVDKRIGTFENSLENIKNLITGLHENIRHVENSICGIKEKNRMTVEKNKSIEEKISCLGSSIEILNNKIGNEENKNLVDKKINLIEQTICQYREILREINQTVQINKNTENTESKIFLEKVQLIERQIKQIFGKISSIEKNNFNTGNEINLLGQNIQKLSDEITLIEKHSDNVSENLSENLSDITSSSTLNLEVKNFINIPDENSINYNLSSNLAEEDDIYEKYNKVQREHYKKKIIKLIEEEKIIIQNHKEIEIRFKTKYPTKIIQCPHGFSSVTVDSFGQIKDCKNTLHLLSFNYSNSKKLIEIVFCKYFIKYLDLESNYNYYINNRPNQYLNIIRFDVKNDIPILKDDCIEYIEVENECLKGIYYVMMKRKKILERFNNTYSKLI